MFIYGLWNILSHLGVSDEVQYEFYRISLKLVSNRNWASNALLSLWNYMLKNHFWLSCIFIKYYVITSHTCPNLKIIGQVYCKIWIFNIARKIKNREVENLKSRLLGLSVGALQMQGLSTVSSAGALVWGAKMGQYYVVVQSGIEHSRVWRVMSPTLSYVVLSYKR